MTTTVSDLAVRTAHLREAFDRTFAEPARTAAEPTLDVMAVGVSGERYALCLTELTGLHSDRPVTPCPSVQPAMIGLACLRGLPVAVYDLGLLIGHAASVNPRWTVGVAASPEIALAFDELDGHLRVPATVWTTSPTANAEPGAGWRAVRIGDTTRMAVSVATVLRGVSAAVDAADPEGART
jgi:purine-binding chemotaxis protein CheW